MKVESKHIRFQLRDFLLISSGFDWAFYRVLLIFLVHIVLEVFRVFEEVPPVAYDGVLQRHYCQR